MSSNLKIAAVAVCGMLYFLYSAKRSPTSFVSARGKIDDGEFIILYVTVPNEEVGKKIATELVNAKLAACVNVLDGVKSYYRWQGKVEVDSEQLLIIKSKKLLFHDLQKKVEALHPYDTPEIVSFPLQNISPRYKKWLGDSTKI